MSRRRPEYTEATVRGDIKFDPAYHKLTCKCGAVVYVVRQASQCEACAKSSKAAHMRETRKHAESKQKPNLGKCPCGNPLDGRITQLYCSTVCRQRAYRERQAIA
jgi:hypothetical protein